MLVIAVYVGRMSSSTRVYMFALAVADLAVCICGMVLTMYSTPHVTQEIVISIAHTSVIFSIYLLAFLSIERLMSVLRPHRFSLSSTRAKQILGAIAMVAASIETVIVMGRLRLVMPSGRFFLMFVTISAVSVMTMSYFCMAAALLKKARVTHTQIAAVNRVNTIDPGPSSTNGISTISNAVSVSASANHMSTRPPGVSHSSVNQTCQYKNISLSLIITAVFLACWMPLWLHHVGLHVSAAVRRIYLLNFAVDPYLYSLISGMFRNDVRQFYRRTRSMCIARCLCFR